MSVAAILQSHGLVPTCPQSPARGGDTQTVVHGHVPSVPTVPSEKDKGATDAMRTRLLTLAEAEGLPAELVIDMATDDLAAWAWFAEQPDGTDDTLRKCLRTLAAHSVGEP